MFWHWTLGLLVALVMHISWACFGGGGGGAPPDKENNNNNKKKDPLGNGSVMHHNTKGGMGGWEVPSHIAAEWKQWLKDFKEMKKKREEDKDYKVHGPDRGPGSGWPVAWGGLGRGDEGFPPQEIPPWGYKPKNTGLPTLCYQGPDPGYCDAPKNPVTRWGYNAHLSQCQEFQYSGCRGNFNNFVSKLACEAECTKAVPGGCDIDTDILNTGGGFDIGDTPCDYRRRGCDGYVPEMRSPNGEPILYNT